MSVLEKICEQASYTLHHINRAKLFTENSTTARLRDILRGWGLAALYFTNSSGRISLPIKLVKITMGHSTSANNIGHDKGICIKSLNLNIGS